MYEKGSSEKRIIEGGGESRKLNLKTFIVPDIANESIPPQISGAERRSKNTLRLRKKKPKPKMVTSIGWGIQMSLDIIKATGP